MSARATRRAFLRLFGPAAIAATPLSQGLAAAEPRLVELVRCPAAGLGYYRYEEVQGALAWSVWFNLGREPGNRYDRRAIAVFTQTGAKLGYVPRACNEALASLMDAGFGLEARVRKSIP